MDKCVLPLCTLVFANPVMLPFTMLWIETLKNNPMGTDDNQDAWDGRVRHFETRLNEVVACTERTERRMGEQIRENSTAIAETRQQIAELRTEMRTETAQTRQQIAELGSGVTQMKGQMDKMFVML